MAKQNDMGVFAMGERECPERFARGEIDKDEFEERRRVLDG